MKVFFSLLLLISRDIEALKAVPAAKIFHLLYYGIFKLVVNNGKPFNVAVAVMSPIGLFHFLFLTILWDIQVSGEQPQAI